MCVTGVSNSYDTHVLKSKFDNDLTMKLFLIAVAVLLSSGFFSVQSVEGFHYFEGLPNNITEKPEKSSSNDHFSRPTFGLSHQNNEKIVDFGFKINEEKFFINDNFHTPFLEQSIEIGEKNTFEATVYAEKGIQVQEFLFGIPEVGEAHNAELGIELWYNHAGEIIEVNAAQKTKIIDEDHISAIHYKTKCRSFSGEEKCDSTRIQVTFLEPIKDKIMALKAIDFKNRFQITYLNEGVDITGNSINPMETIIIPSPIKNEGPIKVTQMQKYSVLWETSDGRIFERNTYGSFKQINQSFERFQDSGEPLTRLHSGFGGILNHEKTRAVNVFNATSLESDLPKTFAYTFPEKTQRVDEVMQAKLKVQELIAKKLVEESIVQARFSNINS